MNRQQIVYSPVICLVAENSAMEKIKSRDFISWHDDKLELLTSDGKLHIQHWLLSCDWSKPIRKQMWVTLFWPVWLFNPEASSISKSLCFKGSKTCTGHCFKTKTFSVDQSSVVIPCQFVDQPPVLLSHCLFLNQPYSAASCTLSVSASHVTPLENTPWITVSPLIIIYCPFQTMWQ